MASAAEAARDHIKKADMVSETAEEALYALLFIAHQDILDGPVFDPLDLYVHAKVRQVECFHSG